MCRARFTPDEVVRLTLDFYKRNLIEGLFLSSGIIRNADETMELVIDVARKLREEHHLWRTYYRSIFNPARLKVRAMQSEMPKKYGKNLPEAPLIAELIAESSERVGKMLRAEERPARPAPKNAYLDSLREKNAPDPSRPDDRRGHP